MLGATRNPTLDCPKPEFTIFPSRASRGVKARGKKAALKFIRNAMKKH